MVAKSRFCGYMVHDSKTENGGITMANIYGYIRVSSADQNEERQLIAHEKDG